ncbi:hypothetical protein FRB96_004285 [Tulasnella sp. 330]|nr:hypothetical protein FRB96_004285 [Tulasnella sp. 330]
MNRGTSPTKGGGDQIQHIADMDLESQRGRDPNSSWSVLLSNGTSPPHSGRVTNLLSDSVDPLALTIEPNGLTSDRGSSAMTRLGAPAVPYAGFRVGNASDLLVPDGGRSLPGDPRDFKVLSVSRCWAGGYLPVHRPWHFLVFECESKTEPYGRRLFVRIGLSRRGIGVRLDVAGSLKAFSNGRNRQLAYLPLKSHTTGQSDPNLQSIGELLHAPFPWWNSPNDEQFAKIQYKRIKDLYTAPSTPLDPVVDAVHMVPWEDLLREDNDSVLSGDLDEYEISRLSIWCQPATLWSPSQEYLVIEAHTSTSLTSSKIYLRVGQSKWGRSRLKPTPVVHLGLSERSLTTNRDLISTFPIAGGEDHPVAFSLRILQDTMLAMQGEAPAIDWWFTRWRFAQVCYQRLLRLHILGQPHETLYATQPSSLESHHDQISPLGGDTVPGYPVNAKIIWISCWRQRNSRKTKYLVVESVMKEAGQLKRLHLRVQEEEGTGWFSRMNMIVRVATPEDVRTQSSKMLTSVSISQQPGLNFINLHTLENILKEVCDGYSKAGLMSRMLMRGKLTRTCFRQLMARQMSSLDDTVTEPTTTPEYGRIGLLRDLMSTDGGISLPADPRTIKLTSVTWYKEYGVSNWMHEYLVLGCNYPSDAGTQKFHVRLERSKDTWTTPEPWIRVADSIDTLTSGSYPVAAFFMEDDRVSSPETSLRVVGELLEIVNQVAPWYILPMYNCWWFTMTCFESILARMGPERVSRRLLHVFRLAYTIHPTGRTEFVSYRDLLLWVHGLSPLNGTVYFFIPQMYVLVALLILAHVDGVDSYIGPAGRIMGACPSVYRPSRFQAGD